MTRPESFLKAVDAAWEPPGPGKTTLRIIGASALILQTGFDRGSYDADVLETAEIPPTHKASLLALAGEKTELADLKGLYIQFVPPGVPFLPQKPTFHEVPALAGLRHLDVQVLDVVDVVVSKLKPYRPRDVTDIKAMADAGALDPERLLARLHAAIDWYQLDARAERDLPRIIKNFHAVQRDILAVPETDIDLPDSLMPRNAASIGPPRPRRRPCE